MINIDKRKIIIITFVLSLALNVFLAGSYFIVRKNFIEVQKFVEQKQLNEKIVSFINLFIEKVLKAEEDVDFEERLTLETTVRDLQDEEVLFQWRKFTESETKEDAQKEVKNLLELLVKKIKI